MRDNKKVSKEKKEKEYLKIFRELKNLRHSIYSLEKVELPKPRFNGYKRFYILREDITRRKDAKDIQQILDKISTTAYSKTKDFSYYNIEYKYDKYNIYLNRQHLKSLTQKQFDELNPHQKTFFYKSWDGKSNCNRYYFFLEWMFVFKIKQHYITHVPMLVPEMESKLSELENKIEKHNLWPRIYKALGGRYRDYEENFIKRKLYEEFLDDSINEVYYGE